jgi:hypothetical protein
VAIALAFARLAAMAAATLDFLFGFGVLGNIAVGRLRFGHAFSSCFRAVASKVSIITWPRSCQICSKSQNNNRADSLTAGLKSAKARFKLFSSISTEFDDSMATFERCP